MSLAVTLKVMVVLWYDQRLNSLATRVRILLRASGNRDTVWVLLLPNLHNRSSAPDCQPSLPSRSPSVQNGQKAEASSPFVRAFCSSCHGNKRVWQKTFRPQPRSQRRIENIECCHCNRARLNRLHTCPKPETRGNGAASHVAAAISCSASRALAWKHAPTAAFSRPSPPLPADGPAWSARAEREEPRTCVRSPESPLRADCKSFNRSQAAVFAAMPRRPGGRCTSEQVPADVRVRAAAQVFSRACFGPGVDIDSVTGALSGGERGQHKVEACDSNNKRGCFVGRRRERIGP
jgi:hypothetical protein